MNTRLIRPLIWTGASAAVLAALTRLDALQPASPLPRQPSDWSAWSTGLDPLDAVSALSHTIAWCVTAYLLLVGLLQLIAVLAPRRNVRCLADAVTPRFVMAAVAGAVVVAGASPAGARGIQTSTPPSDPDPPVMRVLDEPAAITTSTSSTSTTTAPTSSGPTIAPTTMTSVLPPGSATTAPPASDEPDTTANTDTSPPAAVDPLMPPGAAPSRTSQPAPTTEHLVASGEHFWSIAEQTVAARGGDPSNEAVGVYWVRLVDANRDRLVDPDNPDLLFPGQRLVLPR